MIRVEMPVDDWRRLTTLLATKCLWIEANPFLMAIGQQIDAQTVRAPPNGPSEAISVPDELNARQRPS